MENINCGEHDGERFSDPDDCTMYYVCAGTVLHHAACTDGQLFNGLSGTCGWDSVCTPLIQTNTTEQRKILLVQFDP